MSADVNHRYWGIFWIDASSNDSILHSIKRIAGALDVEQDVEAVRQKLADTEHIWLLVFDNVDDSSISLAEYFPTGVRGDIIITCRYCDFQQYSTVGHEEIGSMNRDDAKALLRLIAHGQDITDEGVVDRAGDVVDALGCFPLAVVQIAGYMRSKGLSLEETLKGLNREKQLAQSEVDIASDSGYVSGPTVASSRGDAQTTTLPPMEKINEGYDLQSIRSLSTFVDLGEDGSLWSITAFALNIVDSLSPDISDAIHDREEARLVIQEALEAFSYSVEREDQFPRLSPERQATTFVRQQIV